MVTPQLSCDDPILPEIQAVVLAAGTGSRVTDVSQGRAKCLLQVGNRPLLFYPLKILENAHFTDVIVIIPESNKKEIPDKVNRYFPNLNIDYFPVSEHLGTADSLRLIGDRLKTDVLIMSCDTITDYSLMPLINDFRIHEPTLTCLISQAPKFSSIVGKTKDKTEKDLIGLDDHDKSRIVFLNSEADFVENVSVRMSLLNQCPSFVINRNLLDSHVYIIKKWAIDYATKNKKLVSIKGELLPLLVREQFLRGKSDLKDCQNLSSREELELSFEPSEGPFRGLFLRPDSVGKKIDCMAHMISEGSFCVRANNATSYLEANKFVAQNPSLWAIVPAKTKGVNDSVIGKEHTIGDKSTVRRCVIGKKSSIGSKVKMSDSVLMQKCVVEDGCSIENSVICSGAVVSKNCVIKNCIVRGEFHVKDGEKHANDVIGKHLNDIEL